MTLYPPFMITESAEATEEAGRSLAAFLVPGMIVALFGEMGTGKTVFSCGIARGLGIHEPVTSPTFPIVQTYEIADIRLHHVDLYRLKNEMDALAFGIEELFDDPTAIVVVEWAQRAPGLFFGLAGIRVELEALSPVKRQLQLTPLHQAESE